MLDEIELDAGDDEDSWFSWGGGTTSTLSSGAIFLLSLALLFWNETSSKAQADAYAEAGTQVVETGAAVDPALDGKPVHLSTTVSTQLGARDDTFGLRTQGVALYRHVQMYQWIERKRSRGKGVRKRSEVYYEMDWDWRYHDSSRFEQPEGHHNPKPTIRSAGFFAEDARLGPYRFNSETLARRALWAMGDEDPGSLGHWPQYRASLPELSARLSSQGWFQIEPDEYYLGDQSVDEIEIGDISVTFYEFPNHYKLSLIAAQNGDSLVPWQASNGKSVLIARSGVEDAGQMVSQAISRNGGARSLLRLVGVLGAMLGMAGMVGAISGLLSIVPVLGPLLDTSLRLVGALLGLVLGLFTLVLGWLWARPLIALALLLVVAGMVAWSLSKLKAQRQRARTAQISAQAKQRAADRAAMPPPPPPSGTSANAASVPGNALPPPPPSAGSAPRPSASLAAPSETVAAEQTTENDEPKADLPPLEWEPGLARHRPPSVRPRSGASTPLYNASEPDPEPAALFEQVPVRSPAAAPPPAMPAASKPEPASATTAAAQTAKLVRRVLGRKGKYLVNRILRVLPDGVEQVVCFELMHQGKAIKRGTQDEIRQALLKLQASTA